MSSCSLNVCRDSLFLHVSMESYSFCKFEIFRYHPPRPHLFFSQLAVAASGIVGGSHSHEEYKGCLELEDEEEDVVLELEDFECLVV